MRRYRTTCLLDTHAHMHQPQSGDIAGLDPKIHKVYLGVMQSASGAFGPRARSVPNHWPWKHRSGLEERVAVDVVCTEDWTNAARSDGPPGCAFSLATPAVRALTELTQVNPRVDLPQFGAYMRCVSCTSCARDAPTYYPSELWCTPGWYFKAGGKG